MNDSTKTHFLLHCCKICGAFYKDFFPWGEDGKSATYAICHCCRAEFGNDDFDGDGIEKYRLQWLQDGGHWQDHHSKPRHWNRARQMEHVLDAETVHQLLQKFHLASK